MKVEFKVKPVTRYIVTKYTEHTEETSVITCGEFDNYKKANIVCEALYRSTCLDLEGDWNAECETYDAPQGSK